MPRYVIERDVAAVGKLSGQELAELSKKSCDVIAQLGPQIQWVHSYVTDDKIYCLYIASDTEVLREHARRGGFPANRISEVRATIDPMTATKWRL